jgi:hemoglobin
VASIYDQIGGTGAVAAAVEELYVRVLGDPALAPYFDGIELQHTKHHMRAFIAVALGGGHVYEGRDMVAAHAGLGIDDRAFDRVVSHLGVALHTLGVGGPQVTTILARLAPLRADIVAA